MKKCFVVFLLAVAMCFSSSLVCAAKNKSGKGKKFQQPLPNDGSERAQEITSLLEEHGKAKTKGDREKIKKKVKELSSDFSSPQ